MNYHNPISDIYFREKNYMEKNLLEKDYNYQTLCEPANDSRENYRRPDVGPSEAHTTTKKSFRVIEAVQNQVLVEKDNRHNIQ